MEENYIIKSLLSLLCFSKMVHAARMEVYMGCMPFFLVENDFR
jgi:hypothetical protein